MKRSLIAIASLAAMASGLAFAPEGRRIQLSEGDDTPGKVHFLSQKIELAEGQKQSWVTITRTGDFSDPRYGDFKITPTHLDQMVTNFNARVLGQDVFLDVAHKPNDGAAGKFVKLAVENGKLRGLVEWTEFGVDAVKKRGFAYLSAEYHENWKDNEKQMAHGCVLLGAGLTTRPVIKNLDAVQLSQDDADGAWRLAISPQLLKELTESSMDKFLKDLKAKLTAQGLPESAVTKLLAEAEKQLKAAGEDEPKMLGIVTAFEAAGQEAATQLKKLAQQGNTDPANITITLSQPAVDVDAAVKKILAEQEATRTSEAGKLAANLKLLSDTIAEGDKTLTPEGVKKFTEDFAPLISAATTEANVKHVAGLAVAQAKKLSAAEKLVSLGYMPSGQVHISVDDSNQIKSLQATIDKRLGFSGKPKTERTLIGEGGREVKLSEYAEKALANFDAQHGHKLASEHKMLAAGSGSVSDAAVPAIVERTVLREALYGLTSLSFMDVGTVPFANVVNIPYSYRDTSAVAGGTGLRRYEGQGIRRAGVIQTSEEARPIPQKLAFLLSAEMQLLLGASVINFDPIAENVRNVTRIVGEDTEAVNIGEIVQSADEASTANLSDTLTAQCNGTNKIFVTTQFPVVKPRKIYDLKGVQVGATVNDLVITLNSIVRAPYEQPADGSPLAAGWYYVMNWALGEFYFVNEAGVIQTPTNAWPLTVVGKYTTNAAKWDTDLGSLTVAQKYDDLLFRIGSRKAVLENDRYRTANMALMTGSVDNAITQASTFTSAGARNGSSLNADGSLGVTKGIPTFNVTAPGTAINDNRIVIGERGTSRFRMAKAFGMNPLEQARNAGGLFTDQKETFGTQFIVSHTPTQLKNGQTSLVLYSATGRIARAA